MTTPSKTSAPTTALRYFRSFLSYEIPFRPDDPITVADTEGLHTFYIAYYDPAGRLIRFDKLQLVRAGTGPLTFTLPSPAKPGTMACFAVLGDPANNEPSIGDRLDFPATEALVQFFAGKVASDGLTGAATLFRKDIAFSDSYDYWPNGRLRKRVLTRTGHLPTIVVYDQDGRPTTDGMPETSEASFTHIPATGDWLAVLSAKSVGGLVYRIANHGPASVTLRCHSQFKRADQVRELALLAGNSIDVGADGIDCRVGPEFQGGATIEYRLIAAPPLICVGDGE